MRGVGIPILKRTQLSHLINQNHSIDLLKVLYHFKLLSA